MSRKIWTVIFILFSVKALANNPYDDLIGCYKAVSKNGKPVIPGANFPSQISVGTDAYFVNPDNSLITSLVTRFVVNDNGNNSISGYPVALISAPGSRVDSAGSQVIFTFKGQTKYRVDGQIHDMNTRTTFNKEGNKVTIVDQTNATYVMTAVGCR